MPEATLAVEIQLSPWGYSACAMRGGQQFFASGLTRQEAMETLRTVLQRAYPDEAWPWARLVLERREGHARQE